LQVQWLRSRRIDAARFLVPSDISNYSAKLQDVESGRGISIPEPKRRRET